MKRYDSRVDPRRSASTTFEAVTTGQGAFRRRVGVLSAAVGLTLVASTGCTLKTSNDSGDSGANENRGAGGATTTMDASTPEGGASGDASAAGGQGDGGGGATGGTSSSAGGSSSDAGLGGPDSGTGGTSGTGGSGATGGGGSNGLPPVTSPKDGCIEDIYDEYVVRKDGLALIESSQEKFVTDDTSGTKSTPLAHVKRIEESASAACALVDGGGVWCWQEDANAGNSHGQLGYGSMSPKPVYRAVQVLTTSTTPLTDVVALATGVDSNAFCAITSAGKLMCWGDLTWIENGGQNLDAPYAQPVTDGQKPITGVVQATVHYNTTCALVDGSPNKSVYCWGYDADEELGQGDTKNRQYPTKVPGLTSPQKVMLANNYYNQSTACAIDGDAVLCWGRNTYGATGGSTGADPIPTPTPVITMSGAVLHDIVDLEAGSAGFGVRRSDNSIWVWGQPAGNSQYAVNYGVDGVIQVGWAGGQGSTTRYLLEDGTYHENKTEVTVTCGAPPQQ